MSSIKVTKQDRKKVKNTAIVFCIIFAICAGLASLFIGIMPRANKIETIGPNGEQIESVICSWEGDTYFLSSKNWLYEFDAFTDEKISEFNVTEEITAMLERTDKKYAKNSLTQWNIQALKGANNNYIIIGDGNGNVFKLKKNDEGKLEVLDDCYLIPTVLSGKDETYIAKEIKSYDCIGDDLYFLTIEKGFFYVSKYDMEDLNGGVKAKKFLWDLGAMSEDGYQQIEAMKSGTGILGFSAYDNHIFVFKLGGGITRISTELIDSKYGGETVDFFEDAKKANEKNEDDQKLWQQIYDETYRNSLETYALTRVGKGKFTWTEEQVKAASADEILAMLTSALSSTTVNNEKIKAETTAKTVADEATKIEHGWFKDYNPTLMNMQVKTEYLDKNYYSVLIPGEDTIHGVVYSKKNQIIYYTNASDGYLYSVGRKDVELAEIGSNLSLISKKIDSVHCKEGQSFSNFGNGLGYNMFANTLYLKFENERNLSIVDINDTENYKVLYSFEGDFDMFSVSGDKDNKVTHVTRQVVKVGLDGKDNPQLYLGTYVPEKFEQKVLIKVLFIVFLCLAIVTLIATLIFVLSLRKEESIRKLKFIAQDTKKNKLVYLALVPFITMLFLFCYYEAFGAIAMSFFDYTREKPAWIWNNFANFIKIFNQSDFLPSVLNMLFFLVSDIILSIVPPIIFAILLILIRSKVASNLIRSLMFIPGIIPSIASMLIWRVGIYGDDGILNQIITSGGGEAINWLLNKDFARWSLIFMGFPFIGGYLIFYGGMMNIPKEYHEAGRLEGLGTVKRFLTIDIPLIMPQIKYIFITTFIASVQNFARTHVLRSTVVTTPVQNMYEMMTIEGDYGMSSAYATLIFIFLFAAIAANFKMQKKETMGDGL